MGCDVLDAMRCERPLRQPSVFARNMRLCCNCLTLKAPEMQLAESAAA